MAKVRGGYNSTSLRIALDSSPLWGAARVEDTYNLLGHELTKALSIIAESNQDSLENVASSFSADIVAKTSLKAALDLDWDNPEARNIALSNIVPHYTRKFVAHSCFIVFLLCQYSLLDRRSSSVLNTISIAGSISQNLK